LKILKELAQNTILQNTLPKDNIEKAIVECLENNDSEGVMEVISIYLEEINKSKMPESNQLHRQTIYSALKHKNPTIKTLAKIMHSYTHPVAKQQSL